MIFFKILFLVATFLAEQTVEKELNQSFIIGVRPLSALVTCSLDSTVKMNELDLNDYNQKSAFRGYEIELLM